LVSKRACKGVTGRGRRCAAPPLLDGDYCFWHDPEHQTEAAEARRLGGLRRKREGAVQGAYLVEGTNSIASVRRFLDVAMFDLLSIENSVARDRALISGVLAAVKLVEAGEMEERLAAVEAALGPRVVARRRRPS
jgi:hypothetical protein